MSTWEIVGWAFGFTALGAGLWALGFREALGKYWPVLWPKLQTAGFMVVLVAVTATLIRVGQELFTPWWGACLGLAVMLLVGHGLDWVTGLRQARDELKRLQAEEQRVARAALEATTQALRESVQQLQGKGPGASGKVFQFPEAARPERQ